MENAELVAYWLDTAERDHQTMQHLYASKDYHWALFMGHLVVEKLLKALVAARGNDTTVRSPTTYFCSPNKRR